MPTFKGCLSSRSRSVFFWGNAPQCTVGLWTAMGKLDTVYAASAGCDNKGVKRKLGATESAAPSSASVPKQIKKKKEPKAAPKKASEKDGYRKRWDQYGEKWRRESPGRAIATILLFFKTPCTCRLAGRLPVI